MMRFMKSDEKHASAPEEDVIHSVHTDSDGAGEVEAGDDLHRGMKPRQLSEWSSLPFL